MTWKLIEHTITDTPYSLYRSEIGTEKLVYKNKITGETVTYINGKKVSQK